MNKTMPKLIAALWLLTVCLFSSSVCQARNTPRYAKVYIKTQLTGTGGAVSMNVFDGKTGLFLGETPMTLTLKKNGGDSFPPLSLIVRSGGDGCPAYWQIVAIPNWSKTLAEASGANKKNDVLFNVKSDRCTCTYPEASSPDTAPAVSSLPSIPPNDAPHE